MKGFSVIAAMLIGVVLLMLFLNHLPAYFGSTHTLIIGLSVFAFFGFVIVLYFES